MTTNQTSPADVLDFKRRMVENIDEAAEAQARVEAKGLDNLALQYEAEAEAFRRALFLFALWIEDRQPGTRAAAYATAVAEIEAADDVKRARDAAAAADAGDVDQDQDSDEATGGGNVDEDQAEGEQVRA